MALDVVSYVLSMGYTSSSLDGAGALKGEQGEAGESAYEIARRNGFAGTEAEWLESLKMDATELQSVVQQEVADQIGTTVDERVEEKVTEQIETQLDTTIQDKVDQAIEEALGGSGDSSEIEDEIDSWF